MALTKITNRILSSDAIQTSNIPNSVITADKIANSAITQQKIGFRGCILQVKSYTMTSRVVSSGNFQDIGLDVSITPYSASSTILIMVNLCMSTNATTQGFILRRNGSTISQADPNGSNSRMTVISSVGNNVWQNNMSHTFLDTPNTTSAVNYDIVCGSHDGREWRINRSGDNNSGASSLDQSSSTSTITVMEISP
jgi:hypothetical protein